MAHLLQKISSMLFSETAEQYKSRIDGEISRLESEMELLSGKDNQKDRSSTGKAIAALRDDLRYIDASRVCKGLSPVHGFFGKAATASGINGSHDLDSDEHPWALGAGEVAKLAKEAEDALAELEPPSKKRPIAINARTEKASEDANPLLQICSARLLNLESKLSNGPYRVNVGDVTELESIAQEIVDYKAHLKRQCGYRNKDFKADEQLKEIEHRLDELSHVILPGRSDDSLNAGGDAENLQGTTKDIFRDRAANLRASAQKLAARIARHHAAAAGLGPADTKEVEKLLYEVAEIRTTLKTEGFTEHDQEGNDDILKREIRLAELRGKKKNGSDKAQKKVVSKELAVDLEELDALRAELEMLKREMRDASCLSKGDVKQDPDVKELEERFAVLRKLGGA
eukprot:TRINITY_DN56196_c0_g1_i1.p1 TRINITY_DN56196_c0_g1~~TRINITY_DN56196_c0_g1_i1.p1  ORF type:complete len:400 (+),score=123.06 TRINITY_DN56196_c0_g1_i1:114-1313(+)